MGEIWGPCCCDSRLNGRTETHYLVWTWCANVSSQRIGDKTFWVKYTLHIPHSLFLKEITNYEIFQRTVDVILTRPLLFTAIQLINNKVRSDFADQVKLSFFNYNHTFVLHVVYQCQVPLIFEQISTIIQSEMPTSLLCEVFRTNTMVLHAGWVWMNVPSRSSLLRTDIHVHYQL